MMNRFEVEQTKSTPFVRLEPDTGIMEIGGESYPENSQEFFDPIIQWVRKFLAESDLPAVLNVTLSYMNTSSTKYMIDILDQFENAHENGRQVRVEWHCDTDNERSLDTVEELREDFEMPFEVFPEDYQ